MHHNPFPAKASHLLLFARNEDRYLEIRRFFHDRLGSELLIERQLDLRTFLAESPPVRSRMVCVDVNLLIELEPHRVAALYDRCPLLLILDPEKMKTPFPGLAINAPDQNGWRERIVMSNQELTRYFRPDELIMCQASGVYTVLYFSDRQKMIVSLTLKKVGARLYGHPCFFRSHQSFLVNLNHVWGVDKRDGYRLLLTNDLKAEVSRKRLPELRVALRAA